MSEWVRCNVDELERAGVLLVQDGNHGNDRPRPDEFVEVGIAFIRAGDMSDGRVDFASASKINDLARSRIRKGVGEPGDVLLSHKGTVGRVALVPPDAPPFVCSPQTTFWRALDTARLDRVFLKCFLQSPDFIQQLDSRKGESDMAPYVSLTAQRKLTVVLPPVAEQRAIAGVLGALDEKIESNRRIAAACDHLLAMTAELLSDLPPVPIGDLVVSTREMINPQTLGDQTVDHFSIPAFDANRLPERCGASAIKSGKFAVRERSVLVSRLNPGTPRVWLADPQDVPAMCSTEFLVLSAHSGDALAAVLLAAVSQQFTEEAARRATGTSFSHQRVKPDDALSIGVPDVRLTDAAMLAEAGDWLVLALHARREAATAAALRDALLPELLSGRIRVRDAEDMVAEAV